MAIDLLSVLPSAVSAVGSIFSNKAAGDAQVRAVREQNKGNMELAKYQYDLNMEQWNRENEYNSPASQMARYKAAGLNPNLIYGQQNTSAASPQYQAPSLNAVSRAKYIHSGIQEAINTSMAGLSLMADLKQKRAQTALLEQQTNAAEVAMALNSAKTANELIKKDQGTLDYNRDLELYQNSIDYANVRLNNARSQGQLIGEQILSTRTAREIALQDVQIRWQRLSIEERRLHVQQLLAQVQQQKLAIEQKRFSVYEDPHPEFGGGYTAPRLAREYQQLENLRQQEKVLKQMLESREVDLDMTRFKQSYQLQDMLIRWASSLIPFAR